MNDALEHVAKGVLSAFLFEIVVWLIAIIVGIALIVFGWYYKHADHDCNNGRHARDDRDGESDEVQLSPRLHESESEDDDGEDGFATAC